MEIDHYIKQISNKNLKAACWKLADSDNFFSHPASVFSHHNYVGGLWIHTAEVLNIALKSAESFPEVNKDVLIAAGLWHDYAKIYDYKLAVFFKDEELPKYYVLAEDCGDYKKVYISDSEYKSKIHHITGSTAEFTYHALTEGMDRKTIQDIQHCIISHHSRKEWGSIKDPQSLEAMLLADADDLSAKFGPRKDK